MENMMHLSSQIEGPVAAIGDVHGQVASVDSILQQLQRVPNYEDRWIVFIGDLVDRGPDPKAAIDQVLELKRVHPKTTCVMGNHELAMGFAIGLFETPEYSDWDSRWCEFYGAEETFRSYGAEFPFCADLREKLPDEHAEFLTSLPWAVDHPDFFFVHAGLDPNQSFEIQRRILEYRDFSLSRPPWLCSKDFANEAVPVDCDKVVVSGHVPVPEVQAWKQRILIDTTGGLGGELSCVLLPEFSVVGSVAPATRATPAASPPAASHQGGPVGHSRPSPRSRQAVQTPAVREASAPRKTQPSRRPRPEPEEFDEDYRPKWYEFWK